MLQLKNIRQGCVSASCLAIGVWMTGCASLNESVRLRHADPLPALSDAEPIEFTDAQSLDGFNRTHWETVTVRVAANDTQTYPTFGTWCTLTESDTRRSNAQWPTLDSALHLEDRDTLTTQYLEIPYATIHQFANVVAIPGFAIAKMPPRHIRHGPRHPYERMMTTHMVGEPIMID